VLPLFGMRIYSWVTFSPATVGININFLELRLETRNGCVVQSVIEIVFLKDGRDGDSGRDR